MVSFVDGCWAFLAEVWSWGVLGLVGLIALAAVLAIVFGPAAFQAWVSRTQPKTPYRWRRREEE